jgi:hypothetical protein
MNTIKSNVFVNGKVLSLHQLTGQSAHDALVEMKRLSIDDHKKLRLPGPNPVSIEKKDLTKLRSGYVISPKTDGTRYIMMFTRLYEYKVVMIIDRAMNVYLFPLQVVPRALYQGTLYDGELTVTKTGKPTFVLFDAVIARLLSSFDDIPLNDTDPRRVAWVQTRARVMDCVQALDQLHLAATHELVRVHRPVTGGVAPATPRSRAASAQPDPMQFDVARAVVHAQRAKGPEYSAQVLRRELFELVVDTHLEAVLERLAPGAAAAPRRWPCSHDPPDWPRWAGCRSPEDWQGGDFPPPGRRQ